MKDSDAEYSSSDGNSNDGSDSDGSDSDDAFCFKRKKFSYNVNIGSETKKRPKRRKKKDTKHSKSTKQVIDFDLESSSDEGNDNNEKNNKDSKQQQNEKNFLFLDSDDDSVDIFDKDANNNATTITATETGKINQATYASQDTNTNSTSASTKAVLLLDSDDDDDTNIKKDNNMDTSFECSPTIKAALAKAKKAQEFLQQSVNHVIDIEDDVEDDEDEDKEKYSKLSSFRPATSFSATTTTTSATAVATGPVIQLALRTTIQSSSKTARSKKPPAIVTKYKKQLNNQTNTCAFRTGTTIQRVLDKYYSLPNHEITKYCTVKFMFDGQILSVDKTIGSCDIEDEDLIDVIVNVPTNADSKMKAAIKAAATSTTMRKSKAKKKNQPSENEYVMINTRIKNGDVDKTHLYQLKANDPFEKLIKAYRKQMGYSTHRKVDLEWNAKVLDLNQTPLDLTLNFSISNDGNAYSCLIEIVDEMERVKQVNRMMGKSGGGGSTLHSSYLTSTSSSGGGGGGIIVKIRINGDDKSISTYCISMNAKFQTLMNQVYERNHVVQSDCTFQFDGDRLNPNSTPDDEDLEGDEVIEVKIDKNALEKGKKATSTASRVTSSISTNTSMANIVQSRTSLPQSGDSSYGVSNTSPYNPTGQIINVLTLRNNVSGS